MLRRLRRNWIPLLGSAVLLVLVAVVLYRVQDGRREARALAAGDVGDSAFVESRFAEAIPAYTTYLRSRPEDVDRALGLALSHQFVAQPGDKHILRSVDLLRAVQLNAPNRTEVVRELGELYGRVSLHAEAIALADRVAARLDRWTAETIQFKALGLVGLQRFEEIDPWLDEVEGSAADDAEAQLAVREARILAAIAEQRWADADELAIGYLEMEGRRDPRVLLAAAQAAVLHAPGDETFATALEGDWTRSQDDPGLALAAAAVARLRGQRDSAAERLAHGLALGFERADETTLVHFVGEAERQRRPEDAVLATQKLVALAPRPVYRRMLAARLCFASRFEDVLLDLPDKEAARVAGDGAAGHRAMALFELGRTEEAVAIRETLEEQVQNPAALAWSAILDAVYTGDGSPSQVAQAANVARQADPNNPFVHFWRGQAYRELGEKALAAESLRTASELAPTWFSPALALAEVALELNRPPQAWAAAREAFHRQPSYEAVAALATACVALPDSERSLGADQSVLQLLYELGPEIQGLPAVAIAYPSLLLRVGETQRAGESLKRAIAGANEWPGSWRNRLFRQVESEPGLLAFVAEDPAWIAFRDATREAFLATGESREAQWSRELSEQVARGELLPEDAVARYKNRLEEGPPSLTRVRVALSNPWVAADESLVQSLVGRLADLVGTDSTQWRMAEARRLLRFGSTGGDIDAAIGHLREVVGLAPNQAEPQLLLSRAYLRQNNRLRAVASLERVKAMSDVSLDVNLELAHLYAAIGDVEKARREVEDAVSLLASASPSQRGQAAGLLAGLGGLERAIRLLEAEAEPGEGNAILLANFYRRQGRSLEAEGLYRRLLETPSPIVIELMADFLASDGRVDEAMRTLDLLDSLELEPGMTARIRAGVVMRHDSVEAGYQILRDAALDSTSGTEADMDLWRRLFGLTVRLRPAQEVLDLVEQAARRFPRDSGIAGLRDASEVLSASLVDPVLWPLIIGIFENPDRQEVGMLVLREHLELQSRGLPPGQVADAVRRSANLYPRFLPLQSVAVQLLRRLERFEDATAVAVRAMASFPEAVEPAWMAAEAMAASGRWSEALVLAREWRQRSSIESVAADLMIAEARFAEGDTAGGLEELAPQVQRALQDPERFASVLLGASRVLVEAGELERAERILEPLLQTGSRWRFAWTSLAVLLLDEQNDVERWLERVASAVDAESSAEQLMLVQATRTASERFDDDERLSQMARDRLANLLAQSDPPGEAHLLLAMMDDGDGDRVSAIRGYRRSLSIEEDNAVALNNLAMLLLQDPAGAEEAVDLAGRATELQPHSAAVWDTLAAARRSAGQLEPAADALRTAVQLDPTRRIWREHLAEVLLEMGQESEAEAILGGSPDQTPARAG